MFLFDEATALDSEWTEALFGALITVRLCRRWIQRVCFLQARKGLASELRQGISLGVLAKSSYHKGSSLIVGALLFCSCGEQQTRQASARRAEYAAV